MWSKSDRQNLPEPQSGSRVHRLAPDAYTEKGFITIGPHDKVRGKNKNPERIMFNLETKDVKREFGRIKKIGAKVIAKPYHPGEAPDMMIATFADPDNNYFQLLTPWENS